MSKYGEQVTLSSGYVHTEYRHLIGKATEVYPYFESQWAESRGMPFKISTGLQSRFRLFHNQNHLLFTNVALFFEYEKWRVVPENTPEIAEESRSIKLHHSLSYKYVLNKRWETILTGIFQTKPDAQFVKPRYAGAIDLKYYITNHIGFRAGYRIIYDTAPIVPVPKTYTTFETSLDFLF